MSFRVNSSVPVQRVGLCSPGLMDRQVRFRRHIQIHPKTSNSLACTCSCARILRAHTCSGLPSGKLHGIRTFAVTGIPDDAVPFVNIEEPGDSAALLDAGRCHEGEYWKRETDHILASPTFAGQEREIFCMLTFQKSPTDLAVQHACAQLLP